MSGRRFERIAAAFGNLSLTAKGILVVSLPVCALLIAIAIFHQFELETSEAAAWVEHTLQVRSDIRRVRSHINSLEDSVRGYLLTLRESYLEPYWAARQELPEIFASVRTEIGDNPSQLQHLAKTQEMTDAALGLLEKVRQNAAANHFTGGTEGLELARAGITGVRNELGLMEYEEQRLLEQRTAAEHRALERSEWAIIAGGLVGLLGGFAAALVFMRSIVGRVHRVEELARKVAG
jgi:CHASE3 domain sensor protein